MEILVYDGLNPAPVQKQYSKVLEFLQSGDFASAEVKKMQNSGYYRAKLDRENRLLFKFGTYEGKTYILILEIILNHDYANSRFLRGAKVEETKLQFIKNPQGISAQETQPLSYVNPKTRSIKVLDKIISFDEAQEEIFSLPAPLIVIGSAGSGKTALTLEKIKSLRGNILYITHSPFLVENSANLYYSYHYENSNQEVEFLSFRDYVESIRIPEGREVSFRDFDGWFSRHRQASKIKNAHQLFEEFKGVITGSIIHQAHLSREEYMDLGIKRSIFLDQEREEVYDLFEKYLKFLQDNKLYDLNLVAFQLVALTRPCYDFIIVDEVQDFTNIQLFLVLKSLKNPFNFILSGDSNQIVHPNFFSWSNIKSLFYKSDLQGRIIRVLKTNYRNSPEITELANRLLRIKHERFGSVDRESTYLVDSISTGKGKVEFLENNPKLLNDLNQKTKNSTRFAVVVMRDEDKGKARKLFQTPLLFSIREAKGLEYENIILVDLISLNDKEFREIVRGVEEQYISSGSELNYSRAKDKADKSLEAYKFYVNSLYVAITRAVKNLYIIEGNQKHEALKLLGLVDARSEVKLQNQQSSREDWQNEARKLEKQGKQEQADLIRENILGNEKPDWDPITPENLDQLKADALNPEHFNKKAKDKLFAYGIIFDELGLMTQLAALKYRPAEKWAQEKDGIVRKYYQAYQLDDFKKVLQQVQKYGLDFRDEFNFTPLMASLNAGAINTTRQLLDFGADPGLVDNSGRNCLQVALARSFQNKKYLNQVLGAFYTKLLTESIRVKIDNRLIKIDNHKAEFFIFNFFIALQSRILHEKTGLQARGVSMDDLDTNFESFPGSILPDFRKKRSYINSIMAKNELGGNDPYNKKLFQRVGRGNYVINPDLEIQTKGIWRNVYELMNEEKMTLERHDLIMKNAELERRKQILEERKIEEQRRLKYWGTPKNYWEK